MLKPQPDFAEYPRFLHIEKQQVEPQQHDRFLFHLLNGKAVQKASDFFPRDIVLLIQLMDQPFGLFLYGFQRKLFTGKVAGNFQVQIAPHNPAEHHNEHGPEAHADNSV